MAQNQQSNDDGDIDVFSSLLRLSIQNNAMLEMLIRILGERQAMDRGKEGDDIDKHIFDLFDQVRETSLRVTQSLSVKR